MIYNTTRYQILFEFLFSKKPIGYELLKVPMTNNSYYKFIDSFYTIQLPHSSREQSHIVDHNLKGVLLC